MSTRQLKAYEKLLRHAIGLCVAIFELISDQKAPDWQNILR